jgi:hypothetical protein
MVKCCVDSIIDDWTILRRHLAECPNLARWGKNRLTTDRTVARADPLAGLGVHVEGRDQDPNHQ